MATASSQPTWVRFVAAANEPTLRALTTGLDGRLSRYHVRRVVPVRDKAPANLAQGWSMVRLETEAPISLPQESSHASGSSVVEFEGVTEHLQYTSEAERQALNGRSIPELEPSDHTTAVLIPIGKSEEWWKLPQDLRQATFQRTGASEGHTAIGLKYVDRVFRKLYHSRYLNAVLGYDFLTYFEFKDANERDFRALVAQLRSTPEWGYVNVEFEIWLTKSG